MSIAKGTIPCPARVSLHSLEKAAPPPSPEWTVVLSSTRESTAGHGRDTQRTALASRGRGCDPVTAQESEYRGARGTAGRTLTCSRTSVAAVMDACTAAGSSVEYEVTMVSYAATSFFTGRITTAGADFGNDRTCSRYIKNESRVFDEERKDMVGVRPGGCAKTI